MSVSAPDPPAPKIPRKLSLTECYRLIRKELLVIESMTFPIDDVWPTAAKQMRLRVNNIRHRLKEIEDASGQQASSAEATSGREYDFSRDTQTDYNPNQDR